ncbi:hypothetical protein LAZ67_1002484 [Cordylochernes scorpioides]|uniref:Uncharacterized protein n=1 Tax=Cordylochernes scorpioides TaxID=51811 RepID=A0ABY6JWA4_9ARAC|nr:hypothetical protein LAZ67_1002484 [Cordylochernes scorpioides]
MLQWLSTSTLMASLDAWNGTGQRPSWSIVAEAKPSKTRSYFKKPPVCTEDEPTPESLRKIIVKRDLGLRSYRLYHGKPLSKAAMKNRLDKAKKFLSMIQVSQLSDIVWKDEKIFTVEVTYNHRQLLPPGNKASKKRQAQVPEICHGLDGVTSEGKTPLVFINGNVKIDSQVYQDVVSEGLSASMGLTTLRLCTLARLGSRPWLPVKIASVSRIFLGS